MNFNENILNAGKDNNFPIASLLPIGRENALSTAELVKMSGCASSRELRERISEERRAGAIICSGSGRGYWLPKDKQEIVDFVHVMDARAVNIFAATKSAKEALKLPEGQLEMEING